jgi:hypothetical protein
MRIDQTIVPWTAVWLFYFEEWLTSDEWKGGGVHLGDTEFQPRRDDGQPPRRPSKTRPPSPPSKTVETN